MINRNFYTSNACWLRGTPTSENEDLVGEFEKLKTGIVKKNKIDSYIADCVWLHDAGAVVPGDLGETLVEVYFPLFQKLVECGVSQTLAEQWLTSLKSAPELLQKFIDEKRVGDGAFAVHFVLHVSANAALTGSDSTEVMFNLTFDSDDGVYNSNDSVLLFSSCDVELHVK